MHGTITQKARHCLSVGRMIASNGPWAPQDQWGTWSHPTDHGLLMTRGAKVL